MDDNVRQTTEHDEGKATSDERCTGLSAAACKVNGFLHNNNHDLIFLTL